MYGVASRCDIAGRANLHLYGFERGVESFPGSPDESRAVGGRAPVGRVAASQARSMAGIWGVGGTGV